MKRSKQLRDIFEECLELVLVKGETIEECLRRYPEFAGELKSLLEIAAATKKATAVQPSLEFRERAREQFYTSLRQMPVPKKRAGFSWAGQPRWATVVAVVLALLLVSGGTAAAASSSMPDQPLYTVKRAVEETRLALTLTPLHKAELYAKLADRRVIEIEYLASRSKAEQVQRTSQYLDAHLARIADLASTHKMMMAGEARVTAPMMATPAPSAEKVMPTSPMLGAGAATLDNEARITLEQRDKLRTVVLYQAIHHPERLKAALMNVSPQTRLALLRAIAVSETGYEKALRSLEDAP